MRTRKEIYETICDAEKIASTYNFVKIAYLEAILEVLIDIRDGK